MIEKIAVVLAFSNEMETSIKRRHSGRTCAVKFCSNSSRNIQIWKKSERQIHKPQAHHECPCPRPYALHRFPGRENAEIPFVNIVNTSARTIFKSNLKESNNVRFDCWCHHYFVISFYDSILNKQNNDWFVKYFPKIGLNPLKTGSMTFVFWSAD